MSKRIKVIRVRPANRNIGEGLLVASRARDCVGAETMGIMGLRELSLAPFSSFPGFLSLVPPRVHSRGAHLLGVSNSGCRREGDTDLFTESRWGQEWFAEVVRGWFGMWGGGSAASKVCSRGVFEENLKFF